MKKINIEQLKQLHDIAMEAIKKALSEMNIESNANYRLKSFSIKTTKILKQVSTNEKK